MDILNTPPNIRKYSSLHKYFIHADKMRFHFYNELETSQGVQLKFEDVMTNHYLYLDLWYGMLYVVIEGWQELQIKNEKIDQLLQNPILSEFKRFRNGIFHFQKNYFDNRFIEFISNPESVKWIREIHDEFSKWFLIK